MEDFIVFLSTSNQAGVVYTRQSIPVRITFQNNGDQEIRMLHHFTPLPVFFAFGLTRADGTPIGIPGAGKISFMEGQVDYLTLRKNEFFGFETDLATLIPTTAVLPPGQYELSVTYHNQYGENCFQGQLASTPIKLELT
jgi:hypothetical protein